MLRHTVGLVGLRAALYSGIGWMSNLRGALRRQCAQVPETPALPKRLLADLLSLTLASGLSLRARAYCAANSSLGSISDSVLFAAATRRAVPVVAPTCVEHRGRQRPRASANTLPSPPFAAMCALQNLG